MKKLICLALALLLLLSACGEKPVEVDVNTVEGLSMELMDGYTDRRAAVRVTNGVRFTRYCSDCVYELQKSENGRWYSLNADAAMDMKPRYTVFKNQPSDKINCVWDGSVGQLPEGNYRLVLTLYEGLELGKTEPIYLSVEFVIGSEHFTEAVYVKDESPIVTLECGGEKVVPYFHVNYGTDYSEGGIIYDGTDIEYGIRDNLDKIPEVIYSPEISISLNKNTRFREIVVYTEDFVRYEEYSSLEELSDLDSGIYYVGVLVSTYYEYYEEYDDYSYTGFTALFRMEKP